MTLTFPALHEQIRRRRKNTGSDSSTDKRSAIGVSIWVVGDDHQKWMPRVTAGVTR